jgi:hypothetical protein
VWSLFFVAPITRGSRFAPHLARLRQPDTIGQLLPEVAGYVKAGWIEPSGQFRCNECLGSLFFAAASVA